jgi:hypothetical protein
MLDYSQEMLGCSQERLGCIQGKWDYTQGRMGCSQERRERKPYYQHREKTVPL